MASLQFGHACATAARTSTSARDASSGRKRATFIDSILWRDGLVGEEMVQHDVYDDAGHRDVEPDGKSSPGPDVVALALVGQAEVDRPYRQERHQRREYDVGEEQRVIGIANSVGVDRRKALARAA